ncbi:hypothetical protein [Marinicrinis lubricantis]|uniref:Uncharacterized protein n=1 Tax=Marinicrinis lubricantis TaxID=2086470 RepID=A0ABW1IJ78_9BACL
MDLHQIQNFSVKGGKTMQSVIWSSNLLDTAKSMKKSMSIQFKEGSLKAEEREILMNLNKKKEERQGTYWD